jgi:hypothetical protein
LRLVGELSLVVDLFEEVEEELRSDWYKKLLHRGAPWVTAALAVVLAAYLGYWGFKLYQDRNLAKANLEYQTGVDALAKNDSAGALQHFQAAESAGAPAYKALALMQQAGVSATAGKNQAAADLYDAAAKAAPNQIFADLASLRAAQMLLDTAPLPQLRARLEPLADPKRPFSLYAKEALAMAELMAGQTAAAERHLKVLITTLGVSDDMRERAEATVQLIDAGETPVAIAAVQAAAKLPPPPPMSLTPPQDQPGPSGASQPPAGAAQ